MNEKMTLIIPAVNYETTPIIPAVNEETTPIIPAVREETPLIIPSVHAFIINEKLYPVLPWFIGKSDSFLCGADTCSISI